MQAIYPSNEVINWNSSMISIFYWHWKLFYFKKEGYYTNLFETQFKSVRYTYLTEKMFIYSDLVTDILTEIYGSFKLYKITIWDTEYFYKMNLKY